MANTYSQIYIHVVFAVEARASCIPRSHKERLHKFIAGVIENRGQKLMIINSMPDHIHILLGLSPDAALSDVIRDVKATSSKMINEEHWVAGQFRWQPGFGAFSYSHSQLGTVIRYIQNQEQHHTKKTFRSEYLEMLKRFSVRFDEKYIFTLVD